MKLRTGLARAIKRRDWDAAALYALLALARAIEDAPEATLDDLLAALTLTEDSDATRTT
ncbi:MAG: hypothetical protein WD359_06765 [Dehalococcoidia bacterium]